MTVVSCQFCSGLVPVTDEEATGLVPVPETGTTIASWPPAPCRGDIGIGIHARGNYVMIMS